jgi:hypothetical protein
VLKRISTGITVRISRSFQTTTIASSTPSTAESANAPSTE